MNDLGKVAVIAGIMGILLLFGLFMNTPEPVVVEPVPTVIEQPVTEVTILPQQSLEMLDPVYSEKAIFHDKTIRISFKGAFTEDGVESKVSFWLHNLSDDVINVLWDRCSMQLPSGNTVNVLNEGGPDYYAAPGHTISVAPAGDLFDAFVPVTEIVWTDAASPLTTNVLNKGIFTLVLAIERAAEKDCGMMQQRQAVQQLEPGCASDGEMPRQMAQSMTCMSAEGREIVYYTFRFVIR